MSTFALRIRLEPSPEDRAQLAAYPAADLWPDFAVVTSGVLAVDIDSHAIAYQQGKLVARPAGTDDPATWLPDYLGGFLTRLAEAVTALRPDNPTQAHLLDAPAGLAFEQQGETVAVTWLDRGQPSHHATLPLPALRAAAAAAVATFLAELLAINPRLAAHPEVATLQAHHAALAAPSQAEGDTPFSQAMRAAHAAAWERIFAHPFVTGLGDGTLPAARYRHYLAQDYVFLIDYARVFALAAARAAELDTMARLAGLVHATLTTEMALHLQGCAAAGLTPADLEATRPTPTTFSYTRFLLHTAERGGLGETIAALLPCQCGYGEIALRLAALPGAADGPYADWIASYAGAEYQSLATWLAGLADRLAAEAGPAEHARMAAAYALGLQYEVAFWQMALHDEPWPLP